MSLSKRTARVLEELIKNLKPFEFERLLFSVGYKTILAVYTDGKEAIFGPIVTSAVILDLHHRPLYSISSEDLSVLSEWAVQESIIVSCPEINKIQNVDEAIRTSKLELVSKSLPRSSRCVIVADAVSPEFPTDAFTIIRGNSCVYSLKLASIFAKQTRRIEILELVRSNPEWKRYELEKNLGFQSKLHLQALRTYGKTPHHRYYAKT